MQVNVVAEVLAVWVPHDAVDILSLELLQLESHLLLDKLVKLEGQLWPEVLLGVECLVDDVGSGCRSVIQGEIGLLKLHADLHTSLGVEAELVKRRVA